MNFSPLFWSPISHGMHDSNGFNLFQVFWGLLRWMNSIFENVLKIKIDLKSSLACLGQFEGPNECVNGEKLSPKLREREKIPAKSGWNEMFERKRKKEGEEGQISCSLNRIQMTGCIGEREASFVNSNDPLSSSPSEHSLLPTILSRSIQIIRFEWHQHPGGGTFRVVMKVIPECGCIPLSSSSWIQFLE